MLLLFGCPTSAAGAAMSLTDLMHRRAASDRGHQVQYHEGMPVIISTTCTFHHQGDTRIARTANSLPHVTSAQSVQPSASGRPASEGDQLPGPSFTATLPSTSAAYRAPSACSISTCKSWEAPADVGYQARSDKGEAPTRRTHSHLVPP